MRVKKVKYNWRQAGSTIDRDGAGEDYDSVTVGENDVTSIQENEPHNRVQVWNYIVYKKGQPSFRIFNPNFVEYFSE